MAVIYCVIKETCVLNQSGNPVDRDCLVLYFKNEKIARDNIKKDIKELEKCKYLANCTCEDDIDNLDLIEFAANIYQDQFLVFKAYYRVEPVAELIDNVDVFPDTEELLKEGTYKDQKEEDIIPFARQAARNEIEEKAKEARLMIDFANAQTEPFDFM